MAKTKDNKEPELLTIRYVDIDSLIPAEYNPRNTTEEERQAIRASLKRFGFVDPVIVNRHPDRMNIIVGGHQRVKEAKVLGYKEVPCVFVELTLDLERELNVRLNKNTGHFDEGKLAMHFTREFLKEVGFKDKELAFFLTEYEKRFNAVNNSNCEMPIVPKFSEKYDAVIIVSTNSIDTSFLETALKIDTARSYKNSRTGKAMVITVEQFKEAWER